MQSKKTITYLDMGHQFEVRTVKKISTAGRQLVLILVKPVLRVVLDQSGIVLNGELVPHPLSRADVESLTRLITNRVETETEFSLRAPIHDALLIQNLQDTRAGLVYKIQNILIIGVIDELPEDPLAFVLCSWVSVD